MAAHRLRFKKHTAHRHSGSGSQRSPPASTPPADFTGRADELKELLAAVKTGGVTISGLQGLGGVGKTALALKLANSSSPIIQTRSSISI